MKPLIFDIETKPQPEEQVRKLWEPPERKEIPLFDPSQVKTGNMKDEKKIQAKIDAEREKREKEIADADKNYELECDTSWSEFYDKAALDPTTGEVCAIGLFSKERGNFKSLTIGSDSIESEADLIEAFWGICLRAIDKNRRIIGLNIFDFDLPYLLCRSYALGVDVPNVIVGDRFSKWPKWNPLFTDLRRGWLAGRTPGQAKSNFASLANVFGTGGKVDDRDVSGAEFWKFLERGDADREAALKYLEHDVKQPADWAEAMGL